MASTSGSKRSPSPPSPKRTSQESDVQNENPPRRPGKEEDDIYYPESSNTAKKRRILGQKDQELGRADISNLQVAAEEIFLSNDPSGLLTLVDDFANSAKDQNPQSQVKALWNFCARQFPNTLSVMLANLLNSSLPPSARMHAVSLLHLTLHGIHGQDMSIIDQRMLISLKSLLLSVLQKDESIPNMLNLSEIVANVSSRIFKLPAGEWDELLGYVLNVLHMDLEMKQEMALNVFLVMPETCEKFWKTNYKSLYMRFCDLFDSPNLNVQALTFDASVKLVRMLYELGHYDEIDDLVVKMMWFLREFHMNGQINFVEPRIRVLADLANHYTDRFVRQMAAVLDCVFQIADTADANSVLRCEAIKLFKMLDEQAIDQVAEFFQNLPMEAIRRVFEISVRLMFSLTDDPAWFDIDREKSVYAGISENYHLGRLLLERVCFETDTDMLVCLVIEMIPTFLIAEDWQTRYAGLITFAEIGETCGTLMIRYIDHAVRVLEISLSDPHPRVCWAAIDAIRCFTKERQEHAGYFNKFLPTLVTIFRNSPFPRLQVHAALAIRLLINNCSDEEMKSFSDDLVPDLLKLLKKGEGKLREEAMETVKSLATSFPLIFQSYYHETMHSLKTLLYQSSSSTQTHQVSLGAKSIESLSNIFSGFQVEESRSLTKKDAQQVFTIVFRIAQNWKDADLSVRIEILKALPQLCNRPDLVAPKLLTMVMPILIQSLENTNPYVRTVTKETISVGTERFLACDLLSNFAVRFREQFSQWAPQVAPLFTRLFGCPDPKTQMAAVTAVPNILLSCQHRLEDQRSLFNFTVRALVEALQEEIDRAMSIEMLKTLNACIVISGSVFDTDLIKLIVDDINQILSQQSVATLEVEIGEETSCPDERDERDQEEEIIQSANCVVTMINTLKSEFLTYVDELLPTVSLLWGYNAYPDRVKAVAISIFNLLLKDYPDKLESYQDKYAFVVTEACFSESPLVQQEAARGLGLCAMRKEHISNFEANVALDSLYFVIQHGSESARAKTHDVAVSAFGKICEFYRDSINGPQVVPMWLDFLPLSNDFEEAKYAHQQLCQMLERVDQDILGLNNENLPVVIRILNEILSRGDYLATEETITMIISLLSQFGAMS